MQSVFANNSKLPHFDYDGVAAKERIDKMESHYLHGTRDFDVQIITPPQCLIKKKLELFKYTFKSLRLIFEIF